MTDERDDETLLEAVARGDRVAFEALFRRYHRRVQGFVRRMVDRPELLDEVVNDTLYTVWTSAGTFGGRSSVATWIFGIAYRRALKGIGGRARHERLSDGDAPLDTAVEPHPGRDPLAAAETESSMSELHGALASLSDEHRAVIELTALGHSGQEIAQIVDCPLGTVKTRMFHARRRLRTFLDSDRVVEA